MMVYPNAKMITFVNRFVCDHDRQFDLNHTKYNTSRLNELMIRSLLYEIERERKEDEPKECPLRKVVFTYYDYEGDIFDANRGLKEDQQYFDERLLRDNKENDEESQRLRK